MDFDLIVFDLDGVLVDTSFCHGLAFDDLWKLLGVAGPLYEEIAGRRTIEVVREYTNDLAPSEKSISEWVNFKQQRAREYLVKKEIAFEDSVECIRQLTEQGMRLGLGTGASRETTALVLRRFGWTGVFSAIVTGDDVVHGKPAPEIYIDLMVRSGADPQGTLIVEDSHSGLAAATASRAYAACVRSGHRIESDRFVGNFADIREMINKLGEGWR